MPAFLTASTSAAPILSGVSATTAPAARRAAILPAAVPLPPEMIAPDGNDVTEEMLRYLRPLVRGEVHGAIREGIPQHLRLR